MKTKTRSAHRYLKKFGDDEKESLWEVVVKNTKSWGAKRAHVFFTLYIANLQADLLKY